MRIQLLGSFQIIENGRPITELDSSPRLQAFLAFLIIHSPKPLLRHYVASVLWQDSTESQARTNLRKYIHQIRAAFPAFDQLFEINGTTIQWQPDAPASVDVHTFERCLGQAQARQKLGNQKGVRQALERAVAVYQGDLLPACFEEWVALPRGRFASQYILALDELAQLLEQQGSYGEAIHQVQKLLEQDSLQESSYRRLIQLYELAGNRAKAIEAYRQCATILRQEMGIEPSAATQALYERVKSASAKMDLKEESRRATQLTQKSVICADIVGFTAMSEQFDPQIVFTDFNSYMNLMIGLVQQAEGQLVKRLGDAILVMFDQPSEALQAAYLILRKLQQFNEEQNRNGRPPFQTRIGIATGELLLADLFIEGAREIEIMGKCVNTALQLERVTPVNGITLDQLTYSHCKTLIQGNISETLLTSSNGSEPVYILEN